MLVLLYGQQISAYSYLLVPLILLAVMTGFMWFMNDLLICVRSFKGTFWGSVVALAASLAASPLVFIFDLNGVTYDCMVSSACSIIFMAFWLRRVLSLEFKE